MLTAKDIVLRPINHREADAIIKRLHYSGKTVNNSQLHIGVFLGGKLEGAMQFGPSLDKRKIMGLVEGTQWNEFIELNRMAFSDQLPRNSESRALSIAMKLIRKHAPHIKWVITFADGTQCGDGTIYRAAGFILTQIKKNNQIWIMPDGNVINRMTATDTTNKGRHQRLLNRVTATKGSHILETGGASMKIFKEMGAYPLEGYQLRYIYFLDPACRTRLTVPELPYSAIQDSGAGMYKGQKRASEVNGVTGSDQLSEGGSSPTQTLNLVALDT